MPDTSSASFFDEQYRADSDPWQFATSAYEQGRFDRIAAALKHRRYARALEPGCSIGTLTERLASFCHHVDAFDFSAVALEQARKRCAALTNVLFTQVALTPDTPQSGYDLILFSEIGYYFSPAVWQALVATFATRMDPGTTVLACHWLGASPDHQQGGDEVHAILESHPLLTVEHVERHPNFRLARLCRN